MMDSNYVMGARIVVHNSAQESLAGNSAFYGIKDQIRVHRDSFVDIDEIRSSEMDQEAFKGYDIYNEGTDSEFIMYFPGNMDYATAV